MVAFFSGKGGSTYQVATALARAGKTVCLVDWDGGQASLSGYAGLGREDLEYGIYEGIKETVFAGLTLTNPKHLRDLTRVLPQCVHWLNQERTLCILANNLELAALEFELADKTSREFVLQEFLTIFATLSKRQFDFLLIDCPANRGLLTINALTAADYLFLPIEVTSSAFDATRSMLAHPRFLTSVTGRGWEQEMLRMGLSLESWEALPSILGRSMLSRTRRSGTGSGQPSGQPALDGGDAYPNGNNGNEDFGADLSGLVLENADKHHAPNPKLQIGGVIPFRFDPDSADNRLVLRQLEQLFGPAPRWDEETKTYIFSDSASVEGTRGYGNYGRLLLPVVKASPTYQRSFSLKQDVATMSKRYAPIWDYAAAHLVALSQQRPAQERVLGRYFSQSQSQFQ